MPERFVLEDALMVMRGLRLATISVGMLLVMGARPCLTVSDMNVRIASEEAVILWNERTKTEHFIRGAQFSTGASRFAFVVPTPTIPDLALVNGELFSFLDKISHEKKDPWYDHLMPTGAATASKGVDIVYRRQVGNYDATVLKGDDPEAVTKWLSENHFPTSPRTAGWLTPYVRKHWAFTAFRVVNQTGTPWLQPVRISFRADEPFYPYREPAEDQAIQGKEPRTLRVHLISTGPMAATIGKEPWNAETVFSRQLDHPQTERIRELLGTSKWVSDAPWLTTFEDNSSPRRGIDDLVFHPTLSGDLLWYSLPIVGIGLLLLVRKRVRAIRQAEQGGA